MKKKPKVKRIIGYFFPILVTVVFTIYITWWLEEEASLRYYQSEQFQASSGKVKVTENVDLHIESIKYKDKSISSIKVIRYILLNEDVKSIRESAKFFFAKGDGRILDSTDVLDIDVNMLSPLSFPLLWERFYYSEDKPGFELLNLIGKSRVLITLVLDTYKFPELANSEIQMHKLPGGIAPLPTYERLITFTVFNFILWIILAAFIWGSSWCILNIILGNYSTGARIVNWILIKIGLERISFIPKDKE
ncbi:hypothetical protein MYX76_13635 [Desulfobacterota bacterium AH_259_B03_O07]|nr:hypothetical protein [Desulfobacterota bacterium AH_259_B03_O07]